MTTITFDHDYLGSILADLIRINSINPSLLPGGAGEAAIALYVADALRKIGLSVMTHETQPGRVSVVGRLKGSGGGKSLMLNARLDTVGVDGMPDPVAIPVVGISGGVVLGATQWFALRPAFDKAWLWIVTAGIGWAIGMTIGLTLTDAMGLRHQPWTPQIGATEHGLVGLAVGLGYGIATGLLLARTAPTLDSPA